MNDSALLKLKILVERAVRPVRASLDRKKKMREELLAHVTGVFEEEFSRCGNEITALIQVEKRLGDPVELAQTLQRSVPIRDVYNYFVERLIEPRVGETPNGRAIRYGMMFSAVYTILSVPPSLLVCLLFRKPDILGVIAYILLLVGFAMGVIVFAATIVTNGLQHSLCDSPGRSLFRASFFVAISFFIPLLLPTTVELGMSPFLADIVIPGRQTVWGALPAALMTPCLLVFLAYQFTADWRYRQEWSNLKID